ncbi:P-loop containing nucleoside triphosphate hydrolase protein [Polychytrium aggregatum]|uniref:P-loop containing nucleoside triphosphate hydrolase protein n=1 Tax=Polychytrium aggregatum TaxID=110093 RepID=UPI0022FF0255|nr:P-loop containing nucleoside triphosphate hydrolase protein [Polychytrium aggregatum]KAI9204916.1 P-loop containing nucleoside triphosphate hydrolase protein [Polychytrium aggregatum]
MRASQEPLIDQAQTCSADGSAASSSNSQQELVPEALDPQHVDRDPGLPADSSQESEPPRSKRSSRRKRKKKFILAPANVFSRLFFFWIFQLVQLARAARDIRNVSLGLRQQETARLNGDALEAVWEDQLAAAQSPRKPSLVMALIKAFGRQYALLSLWKVGWAIFTWLGSYYLLKWILIWNQDGQGKSDRDPLKGHLLALGLLLSASLSAVCFHQLTIHCTSIGVKIRAALMVMVYRKSLKLSYVKGGIGDVVNLISIECNRIAEASIFWNALWSAILESLIIVGLAYDDIGWSGIPSFLLVILVFLPIQYYLATRVADFSYQSTVQMTQRVHLMSEVLTTIKLIKFYAWERYYEKRMIEARQKELRLMRKALLLKVTSFVVVFSSPLLSTLTGLLIYYYVAKKTFDSVNVFTLLSLFNTLRYPLLLLPTAVKTLSAAKIAVKRLEDFLSLPEIDVAALEQAHVHRDIPDEINASFIWDGDLDHPHISELTLELRRGQIIAVVGDLASGKSLLAALMRQIKLTDGVFETYGTCGYVPQEPWIINASIRDNILFGHDLDEQKYVDVIRLCGLTDDLLALSNGDTSLTTELNLSNSQKQRISLARCVYHDPDIIFLEDCLSDFDQSMAKRIFKELIKNNLLKTKAMIMVTQQKQFLPDCDTILVLKSGRVVIQGSFAELKAKKVNFSSWVAQDNLEANQATIQAIQTLNSQSIQSAQIDEATITMMIERDNLSILKGSTNRPPVNFVNQDVVTRTVDANQLTVHSVLNLDFRTNTLMEVGIARRKFLRSDHPLGSYALYLEEGSGTLLGVALVLLFFAVHAIRFASAVAFGGLFRGMWFSWAVMEKSISLHDRTLRAVLQAPMSFFDITPLGQILSHFARHLYVVDEILPESLLQILSFAPIPIGTVILVSIVVPWFWATLPLYFILGLAVYMYCQEAETKFKNLEASNKAPMFSHLSATLEGLFSIRLYNARDRFDSFNLTLIDADHKALYSLMLVKSMMSFYIDIICALFIYVTVLFLVIYETPSSKAGLALSNALQLLLFVHWLTRTMSDVHSSISSVESVVKFQEQIPHSPPRIITSNRPPSSWPKEGAIEFKNVVLRYNRYGVVVLKNVSFRLSPGEKISIVGRSGSGKTTILVALLRIAEASEGDIIIDGINISTIGIADLRSRIAVIPQEPILLTGTIRSNLDPFGSRTDEAIWNALKSVHLGAKIQEMPERLDTPIAENGKTFSVSERQLFCIARAILLDTRVVVLDEPTNAIDAESTSLVEETIKQNFANATVIVLASRFHNVIRSDRIMVMDAGRIVEFDTPINLLNNPRGKFSRMVSQKGDIDVIQLKEHARAHADDRSASRRTSKVQTNARRASDTTSPSLLGQQLSDSSLRDLDARPSVASSSSSQSSSDLSVPKKSAMPKSLELLFEGQDMASAAPASAIPKRLSESARNRSDGSLRELAATIAAQQRQSGRG